MESFNCPKTFIITNNLRAKVANTQLDTVLTIETLRKNSRDYDFITMNFDRWTEFKKNINAIDEEFQTRFRHQYPDDCWIADLSSA